MAVAATAAATAAVVAAAVWSAASAATIVEGVVCQKDSWVRTLDTPRLPEGPAGSALAVDTGTGDAAAVVNAAAVAAAAGRLAVADNSKAYLSCCMVCWWLFGDSCMCHSCRWGCALDQHKLLQQRKQAYSMVGHTASSFVVKAGHHDGVIARRTLETAMQGCTEGLAASQFQPESVMRRLCSCGGRTGTPTRRADEGCSGYSEFEDVA